MADGLLFNPGPTYPTAWILGLIAFLAYWWYIVRSTRTQKLWFVLWVPSALVAALVYRLGQQGQSAADTLRLLAQFDRTTLSELGRMPADAYTGTYAFVVGGTAAALLCMALHLAGLLVGGVLGLFTPSQRRRRT